MFTRTWSVLVALVIAVSPVGAEERHDHGANHGGIVVESGHHHLEITVVDGRIDLYVKGEDGQPEDVKHATAKATVLSERKKEDIVLSPEASNMLSGMGAFKAVKGTTVVITLTMPGHAPEQARVRLD